MGVLRFAKCWTKNNEVLIQVKFVDKKMMEVVKKVKMVNRK